MFYERICPFIYHVLLAGLSVYLPCFISGFVRLSAMFYERVCPFIYHVLLEGMSVYLPCSISGFVRLFTMFYKRVLSVYLPCFISGFVRLVYIPRLISGLFDYVLTIDRGIVFIRTVI